MGTGQKGTFGDLRLPVAEGYTPRAARHRPLLWGLAAGVSSAAGALCLIFAVTSAGPGGEIYVAPLVFAGAPIVNTLATLVWFRASREVPDWRFFVGIVLAATGAALILWFRPDG